MISQLKNWKGAIEIDGTLYNSIEELSNFDFKTLSESSTIKLLSSSEKALNERKSASGVADTKQFIVTVKSYMTKPATQDFDFMAQWNNNEPMPLRTMVGQKLKETRGMVYMSLHGDIVQKITPVCMKCGKPIENKVSQFFGMGPICGNHNYENPFDSDADLQEAVERYRQDILQKITWTGWIIKSAIISESPVE